MQWSACEAEGLAGTVTVSQTTHGLSLPFVVLQYALDPNDTCLVSVAGSTGPALPGFTTVGLNLQAPQSTEPQAPAPARIGLVNTISVVNTAFMVWVSSVWQTWLGPTNEQTHIRPCSLSNPNPNLRLCSCGFLTLRLFFPVLHCQSVLCCFWPVLCSPLYQ